MLPGSQAPRLSRSKRIGRFILIFGALLVSSLAFSLYFETIKNEGVAGNQVRFENESRRSPRTRVALTSSWLDAVEQRAEYVALSEKADMPSVELGVVPVNEYRRLLFPFSKLGIDDDAVIESFTTSCECIRVCVVEPATDVLVNSNTENRLIEIEYLPGVYEGEYDFVPLQVECVVHLNDAVERYFIIDFRLVCTKLHKKLSADPKFLESKDALYSIRFALGPSVCSLIDLC